jgi:hypothetical protein
MILEQQQEVAVLVAVAVVNLLQVSMAVAE